MQIHQLKRKTENKKRMIVARGGKRGKTAGRGTKGQKARAGRKIRPEIRDIIKRIPKLRGRGKNSNLSIDNKPTAVNIKDLEKNFSGGEVVTRAALLEKGLISNKNGKLPEVKLLGLGEATKKFQIKGIKFSASVKEKIEKAGGSIS
ncbi:MAG: 50S ribosomal protein L15 [bacterium]|nr:50S ribosomal protein L15 [bacterium]